MKNNEPNILEECPNIRVLHRANSYCLNKNPDEILDVRSAIRKAYYDGFKTFFDAIIVPMFEAGNSKRNDNPFTDVYASAFEDIAKVSGFTLPKQDGKAL